MLLTTVVLFATVPNSRRNSWFILTCGKNKQISHAIDILFLRFLFFHESKASWSPIYIYSYLSGYSLQYLANMSILAPPSSQTEPFPCSHLSCVQFACLGPPRRLLFVPTTHISHMQPSLNTRRPNTFIQLNTIDVWHTLYNRQIYSLQHFFSCLCF